MYPLFPRTGKSPHAGRMPSGSAKASQHRGFLPGARRSRPDHTAEDRPAGPAISGLGRHGQASDFRCELRGVRLRVARGPFESEPRTRGGVRGAGNDVDVHVHHRLVGGDSVVLEKVVGRGSGRGADGAADPRQHPSKSGGGGVRECSHGGFRLLGDDQGVASAEGRDVEERENVFVLEDAMAGDLSGENA